MDDALAGHRRKFRFLDRIEPAMPCTKVCQVISAWTEMDPNAFIPIESIQNPGVRGDVG
jgi:hypothetical protein